MTLPSSGTISMGMVKTELGLSAGTALTLTDSRVRNLFGIPSGVIKLTDGYGKTAWTRPVLPSGSTYANAYDTSGTTIDTTTKTGSDGTYTGLAGTIDFYSFPGGVSGGTLYVRAYWGTDHLGTVTGTDPIASQISYSTDGGTNWTPWTSLTTTAANYSISLSGITLSNLRVRFSSFISIGGSIKLGTDYNNLGWVS